MHLRIVDGGPVGKTTSSAKEIFGSTGLYNKALWVQTGITLTQLDRIGEG
jgi:hypothetical protein